MPFFQNQSPYASQVPQNCILKPPSAGAIPSLLSAITPTAGNPLNGSPLQSDLIVTRSDVAFSIIAAHRAKGNTFTFGGA